MTPNGTEQTGPKLGTPVTRTVFDLATFDDVKLTKPFPLPEKPATVADALALVANDESKLLDLIYKGVVSAARDAAYNNIQGFLTVEDNEPYAGKCADEETGKRIDGAILSLAKLAPGWAELSKDQKDAAKKVAADTLRSLPKYMESLIGKPVVAAV